MAERTESPTIGGAPATETAVRTIRRSARWISVFARRRPLGAASGAILLVLVLVAATAPLIAPEDPLDPDVYNMKGGLSLIAPLGTDYQGRDLLSRVIYGTRISIAVSILAILLGTTTGSIWGVGTAYIGGKFDLIGQRFLEVIMAFPALILAMILVSAMGPGFWVVVIAIAATRVPYGCRVIRSVALAVKENDYVLAARAIGASQLRIMVLHIAPQCIASYLVLATAHLGVAIVIEASLGFIGVGIPPPTATWGNMLGGAVASILIPHWPLVFWPGAAITITVLAFNLFGDAIRDVLDPRLRGTASG